MRAFWEEWGINTALSSVGPVDFRPDPYGLSPSANAAA